MRTDLLPAHCVLAANRIGAFVRETPLEYSPFFSDLTGAKVWLKLENFQLTGSFKLRGACNKLLSLAEAEKAAGCVAASSGNHGAAVAYAMQQMGIGGIIFVPESASPVKVEAIRRAGGEVRFYGTDGLDTEQHARAYAEEHGMTYLSPYNDPEVIAGQGSCGVEIARQLDPVDALYVAVGGGGLISGAGAFLKSVHRQMQLVACQPSASAVMAESAKAGELLDLPSDRTLSDGTAGGIEPGAITFDLCRQLVDEYVLVSEAEIAEAMRNFIDAHHMLLEGAAGVALAALRKTGDRYAGKNVVAIVCGANISRAVLKSIL